MNMKVTPSPRIDRVTANHGVCVVQLESNRDAETCTTFTIEFDTSYDVDGISPSMANTCTQTVLCENTGDVITEDVVPTPDWVHVYVACDVQTIIEREATEAFLDSCY
jgi:hypothetical protein